MGNLTFEELNRFTNENIYNINEMTERFCTQNAELNNFLRNINLNDKKVEEIGRRLCILKYYQNKLDALILEIGNNGKQLDETVTNFEQKISEYKYETPIDCMRQKQYEAAENIFNKLKSYEHTMNIIHERGFENECLLLSDPLEKVAKIMESHLEILESIEMKTIQMNNYLQLIENEKRKLLKLYKLKLNSL